MTHELPSGRRVAPSILASDYGAFRVQVQELLDAGARAFHCDVMDGHFVPPITIGTLIVESLRDQVHEAGGWLDVHLMVERPERHVAAFAEAGADSINIHEEATPHVNYALNLVRDAGCRAGLAITPATCSPRRAKSADRIDGATRRPLGSAGVTAAGASSGRSGCR